MREFTNMPCYIYSSSSLTPTSPSPPSPPLVSSTFPASYFLSSDPYLSIHLGRGAEGNNLLVVRALEHHLLLETNDIALLGLAEGAIQSLQSVLDR